MARGRSKGRKKGGKGRASQAERRRRGRIIGLCLLGGVVLLAALYLIDRGGPLETIGGVVIDTSTYNHTTGQQGSHTHIEAVLESEGHRFSLRPGDGFQVGDPVTIEIRRGRLTGYPYFQQAYHPRP